MKDYSFLIGVYVMKKGKLRGKYNDMKDYRSTTKKKKGFLKSKVGVKYCDINGKMIRLYTSSKGPTCGLKNKLIFIYMI